MRKLEIALLTASLFAGVCAFAQTPEELEQERQLAFRNGMEAIVARLNEGSTDRFVASTRQDEMVERIFGLRLIDQKVKRQFVESLEFSYDGLIKSAFPAEEGAIRATLLGVESRGDRGRAVVRFDLPDFQFNYHEYELRLDAKSRLVVDDWTDYLKGEKFTEGVGMMLIRAAPGRPAVRKLIDYQNVRDSDLFQFTELLKAARDRRADRYVEIINSLNERLRGQKVVVLGSVQLAKQIRNRRMLRTALVEMARYYPEEPLFSLSLLDYYFPARKYEEALQALLRLDEKLGVDDAAMQARLSAARLVMGRAEDANAHAEAALELEPGLELAWWSALRARAAVADYAAAVEALQRLESGFGHELDRPALERDRGLSGLLGSEEYARWRENRG